MRFGIAGWMLLGSFAVTLVHGVPCNSFRTIEECQGTSTTTSSSSSSSTTNSSTKCVWCEASNTCGDDQTQCESEPIAGAVNGTEGDAGFGTGFGTGNNDTCSVLQTEGNCSAVTSCVWCSDIEICTGNAEACNNFLPGEECSTDNCTKYGGMQTTICSDGADSNCTQAEDGDGTSDHGGSSGEGQQQNLCRPLSSETECSSSPNGCVWCAVGGFCGSQYDSCSSRGEGEGGQMTDDFCRSQETEANCTMVSNCTWCSDQEKCRNEAMGCSHGEGEGMGGGGGGGVEDFGGEKDRGDHNKCIAIGNETECAETEMCFWCADHDVCRPSFKSCPGNDGINGKPNLCLPLTNETDCLDSGSCVWCNDTSLCRSAEEECPGRGRSNICRDLTESICDLADGCTWWDHQGRCGSQRGIPPERRNNTDDEESASVCPLLMDEGNCTLQFHCRWCPQEEKCQSALDSCEDGSLGVRGNPCRQAEIEEVCTNTFGCLWCAKSSKCKKATIEGCDLQDGDNSTGPLGNLCMVHDVQIECEEVNECQWCEAQSKCKSNQTACEDPSGIVDLAFDENNGPSFQIRDDGLGSTDPYAVTVTLNYLYEVTADGKTIDASLVDLEAQVYNVTQSVGYFFENNIEARQIHFDATIDGVGTIAVDAYIMLDDGNITTPGTESWVVAAGDVKFNVEVSDWTFCGDQAPCGTSNETSAYLDLAFSIRGNSETPQENEDNALVFNLGGNVPLLLSSEIEKDGFMQDMPDGFPRVESSTSQGTMFMFRFPRFTDGVSYDPIIPYSYSLSVLQSKLEPTVPPVIAISTNVPKPPTAPPTLVPITSAPQPLSTDDGKDGMSGGAIAGMVIGILLGLCCCCAGIGYLASRKKQGEDSGYRAAGADDKHNVTMDGDDFDDEANGRRNGDDDDDEEEGSSSEDSDRSSSDSE